MNQVVFIWKNIVHELEQQADVGFSTKSLLFACYVKEVSIHAHCTRLAESIINIWLEGMDCLFRSSAKFYILSGKCHGNVGEFQKPLAMATMKFRC